MLFFPPTEAIRPDCSSPGCFMINILIWGFALSFGILQEYYSAHEPLTSRPNGVPAVGKPATGLMYLLMLIYFSVLQRWPVLIRYST